MLKCRESLVQLVSRASMTSCWCFLELHSCPGRQGPPSSICLMTLPIFSPKKRLLVEILFSAFFFCFNIPDGPSERHECLFRTDVFLPHSMVMYSGCHLLSPGNLNEGQLKINKLDICFDLFGI